MNSKSNIISFKFHSLSLLSETEILWRTEKSRKQTSRWNFLWSRLLIEIFVAAFAVAVDVVAAM